MKVKRTLLELFSYANADEHWIYFGPSVSGQDKVAPCRIRNAFGKVMVLNLVGDLQVFNDDGIISRVKNVLAQVRECHRTTPCPLNLGYPGSPPFLTRRKKAL